jgi:glycosyl transferase family 25
MDIPIFIIHYKKLVERKAYLEKELSNYRNVTWMDDIDRDLLTPEQLSMYKYDETRWNELNALWGQYDSKPRKLSNPEIACTITHINIYKKIIDDDIPFALIFEDDEILLEGFDQSLQRVIDELNREEWDICHLNDAFGWNVENYKSFALSGLLKKEKNRTVYKMNCSKCTDSYLITKHAATVLYNSIIPFCLPIDWMHNPIYKEHGLNVYWADPPITHQGSVDVYSSSLRNSVEEKEYVEETDDEEVEKFSTLVGEKESTKYASLSSFADQRLEEFTQMINNNVQFSIIKFGDGEMRNMTSTNENEHNCDGCNYFKSLGLELIKAYIFFLRDKNTFINKWHSHVYLIQEAIEEKYTHSDNKFVFYDLLVHKSPFNPVLINFFKSVKRSKRIKVYISNVAMIKALIPVLDIQLGIIVPEINCYLHKDAVYKSAIETLHKVGPNAIILFSCGMFSKVLAHKLMASFPNNTYLDIGSTFDGLIKFSRDFNGTFEYQAELLNAYK